ncbi:MAG TPA: c-type cytochrome [Rhizomicrobium sp.]|nr:c-type cytochrome [Rhizomicrobium sp.]
MPFRTLIAAWLAAAFAATAAQAAGNAAAGASVFDRCAICHSNTKGAPAKIGPNLFGIVGRKAAAQADFSYSTALKNSGIVWSADKLDAWIASPATLVPGNRMAFAGIASAQDRANLVAYLATLK